MLAPQWKHSGHDKPPFFCLKSNPRLHTQKCKSKKILIFYSLFMLQSCDLSSILCVWPYFGDHFPLMLIMLTTVDLGTATGGYPNSWDWKRGIIVAAQLQWSLAQTPGDIPATGSHIKGIAKLSPSTSSTKLDWVSFNSYIQHLPGHPPGDPDIRGFGRLIYTFGSNEIMKT